MDRFGNLPGKMKGTCEAGRSHLDHTVVSCGSHLGNASAHTCDNLPSLLAGGGFRHAGHMAFDRKENHPLSNRFARMLRQMGLGADRFGTSAGVLGEV
jgi:hypothetical protein